MWKSLSGSLLVLAWRLQEACARWYRLNTCNLFWCVVVFRSNGFHQYETTCLRCDGRNWSQTGSSGVDKYIYSSTILIRTEDFELFVYFTGVFPHSFYFYSTTSQWCTFIPVHYYYYYYYYTILQYNTFVLLGHGHTTLLFYLGQICAFILRLFFCRNLHLGRLVA